MTGASDAALAFKCGPGAGQARQQDKHTHRSWVVGTAGTGASVRPLGVGLPPASRRPNIKVSPSVRHITVVRRLEHCAIAIRTRQSMPQLLDRRTDPRIPTIRSTLEDDHCSSWATGQER